jgi:type IV secretion system protein VirD4
MGMFGGNDQDRSGRTPPPSENPFLKNVGARDPLTPPQRPAPQATRRSQETGLKGFVKKLFGGKEPDLEELGRRAGAQARAAQSKAEEFLARDDVQEGLKTARTEAAKAAQSGLKAAESGASYLARKNAETGFLGKVWAAVSPHKIPLALFVIGCFLIYGYQVQVTYGRDAFGYPMRSSTGPVVDGQIALGLLSGLGGFLLGFLPILIFSRYRGYAFAALGLLLFAFLTTPSIGTLAYLPLGAMGLFGGLFLGAMLFFKPQDLSTDAYGSARLARRADIEAAGLMDAKGYRLGLFEDAAGADLLHYAGQRHLLTCAPTRAGKGVSSIIPNLLTYEGSILVIDPKGENLMITAEQRHRLGHDVQALDPWNIGASFFEGAEPSRFNPLDFVEADSPDLVENAMILADALVPVGRGDTSFWDEEAKALLMGLILHVATDEAEQAQRHLPRVRDLLLGDDKDMNDLFEHMMKSEHPAVRGAGARTLQKEPKMRSSVLATAQAHTHFLDSPRIRESMSASNFRFADMKRHKLSVYVILPADRLSTFDRWLRLIISIAIIENARNIDVEPEHPVLFLLDEMAALGRLKPVETAFGLMAGFGMQLWGIVQDLSQLERIYGKGWETFVGNSGVLQYFGSRDKMTAEYFSALCGIKTAKTIGGQIKQALGGGVEEPGSYGETGRPLFMPDELMVMKADRQLLLVETNYPIVAKRVAWFNDPALKPLGRNLKF